MDIHLFRDESSGDIFAFSVDVTGENIPPVSPMTEWIFLEAIDTLRFPEPWDVADFRDVLDHLRVHGYYLFQGELIEGPKLTKGRRTSMDC
jgi:hypothetical protein